MGSGLEGIQRSFSLDSYVILAGFPDRCKELTPLQLSPFYLWLPLAIKRPMEWDHLNARNHDFHRPSPLKPIMANAQGCICSPE